MELREAQCGGAFLVPGLFQQQHYLWSQVKSNLRMGKHRQKIVLSLGEEPLLPQPVPQSWKHRWLMKSYKQCTIFPCPVGFSKISAALSGWFWVMSLEPVKAREARSALVSSWLPPIICQSLPKTPSRIAAASWCDLLPQTPTDKLSSPAPFIRQGNFSFSWALQLSPRGQHQRVGFCHVSWEVW